MNHRRRPLDRALLWLGRRRLLEPMRFVWPVQIAGARWRIPVEHGVGLGHVAGHEPWMVALLRSLLPRARGAFVDVGANIGQTLLALKSAAPGVAYVGFEPNPAAASYLQLLIQRNHWRECTVIAAALGDAPGMARLVFYGDTPVDDTASTCDNVRPTSESKGSMWVAQLAFGDTWRALGEPPIGMVKIDVEGGELAVLQGMKEMLTRERPIVLCEVLPVYTASNTARLERQRAIEALFRDVGYRIQRVSKSPEGQFLGLTPIAEIGIHADLAACDYVCVPQDAPGPA